MNHAERDHVMKKRKRILSLGLAVLMAASVTACGGTQKDENSDAAKAVADFLLHCTDHDYQHWWPGTHLAWRTKTNSPTRSAVWFTSMSMSASGD